jgi:hypothetical protein
MQVIYLLTRAGVIIHAYATLELAQRFYPGTWEEEYNGPIRVPEYWNLGDARIYKLPILTT